MRSSIKAALLGVCLAAGATALPGIAAQVPRSTSRWHRRRYGSRPHRRRAPAMSGRPVTGSGVAMSTYGSPAIGSTSAAGYHWVPDRWEQVGPRWHHYRGALGALAL